MTVGERIKFLRKNAGYTRVAFAEKIGIPHTTLRNYENDEREPGHKFLIIIAKEFNVTIDYLLGLDDETKKTSPELSRDAMINEIINYFAQLSPEERQSALDYAEFLIYRRNLKVPKILSTPDL